MSNFASRRVVAWSMWRQLRGTYLYGACGVANPSGAQCVNVPNTFWCRLGLQIWEGNAGDWAGRSDRQRQWSDRSLLHQVRSGDVVVWRTSGVLPFGHVALVLWRERDALLCLQQNSPLGGPVAAQRYVNPQVAGFLRVVG